MIRRTTYTALAHVLVALFLTATMITFADAQTSGCGTDAQSLKNPINFCSIPEFLAGALKALAMIALPIISLFLVISGFMFVTAQGNQSKLDTAKKNFLYVIIGALLILGAWIIATLIAGTVNQLASVK